MTGNHKIAIIGATAFLGIVVFVAVFVGTTLAQRSGGDFDQIRVHKEGDDAIVASVQGKNINREYVRKAVEYWMEKDSTLTRDTATSRIIVPVIDEFIMLAEVERRGLVPTSAEADAFMAPNREACLGEHGEECRNHIEALGYDVDNYWTNIAPAQYRNELGDLNLIQAVIKEQGLSAADSEQRSAAVDRMKSDLRSNATIVWYDEDLKRKYQKALPAK